MAEYLEFFDLDLLPSMSPDTSDQTGGGSKENQLEKFNFITSAAEKDHLQCTMAPAQDEEESSNNMSFTSSDEAYAAEAVNLLDLDVSDDTATRTSKDDTDDCPSVEVPLSSDQLEQILQTTGIGTARTEQKHLQPVIENINQESKCSVLVIKFPATCTTSLQYASSVVTPTTTGCQIQNPPLKEKKTSRRRREKKEKMYQKPKCDDEKEEKKRQRAINAYMYRDKKKQEEMALYLNIEEAVKERDELITEVEKEKEKNKKLMAKLELVKEACDQA